MRNSQKRVLFPFIFFSFVFCILTTSLAQADIVPWMTGHFGNGGLGSSAFTVYGWQFDVTAEPIVENETLVWTCPDPDVFCFGQGGGDITGGIVTGNMYHDDGFGYTLIATFNGHITPGGWLNKQAWFDHGQETYWDQYYYDFTGLWTNGFSTVANAYSSPSSDGSAADFNMTTVSPEAGTFALLGSALVGVALVLRRRLGK